MQPTVELYKENLFAISFGENKITDAFSEEPVVHENKEIMEYLAAHIGSKEPSEKGFALDEPYATLYYTLSWLREIRGKTDVLSSDPHWEISCDPVFHMEPGPPMIQAQMAAYQPIKEWLEELGASHVDLPLLYISTREQEDEAKKDTLNYIGKENSQPILDQWNSLSDEEKAAALFLQYHIDSGYRHSFCGAIMLIKRKLSDEQFAEICCAASNVSPYMGDISDEMFERRYNHFAERARFVKTVLKMLISGIIEK